MNIEKYFSIFPPNLEKFSTKKAIITPSGFITFSDLVKRVDRLAASLCALSKEEEIIGIYMDRGIEMILSILAIMNAGCAFLPLSPKHPKSRVKDLIKDAGVKKIISTRKLWLKLEILDVDMLTLEELEVECENVSNLPKISGTCLAYLMYTSGSTGKPKGVLVEHLSLKNIFSSFCKAVALCSEDVFLALTDYTFDISLLELVLPLTVGASVIISQDSVTCSGDKMKHYIERYAPTIIQATPLTWDILLKSGWKNQGLFKIISGGEALSLNLANKLSLEHNNVWNMYGPTETTIWSSIARLSILNCLSSVPIGTPITDTNLYVLDESLNFVSPGNTGELYISGIGLARGYKNKEKLTKESFIYHPRINIRMYKTGDIVRLEHSGKISYLGRSDDQVKIGGIRLEPREIERSVEEIEYVKKSFLIKKGHTDYCKQLILYIEIDDKSLPDQESTQKSLISSWKSTYNTVYRESTLNLYEGNRSLGWINSFNSKPFSKLELDESVCFVVNNVRKLNKPKTLEIGCGVGNVTLAAIDHTSMYTAIDCSEEAIRALKKSINAERSEKLIAKTGYINDLENEVKYDCIIMHSVSQYFPSSKYFLNVIEKFLSLSNEVGTIILSDLRNPELLDLFLLEKACYKQKERKSLDLKNFYFKNRDNELLINPDFFYFLKSNNKRISFVDISIRNGSFHNELNSYRYDVCIHIGKNINVQEPVEHLWKDILNKEELNDIFSNSSNDIHVIRSVPNVPVLDKMKKITKMFPDQAKEININTMPIDGMERVAFDLTKDNKINKDNIYVKYKENYSFYLVDIFIYPLKNKDFLVRESQNRKKYLSNCPHYFREPFNMWSQNVIFKEILDKLSNDIPKCMHPSSLVWVEKWPRLINDKIDKNKLHSLNHIESSGIKDRLDANVYRIWFETTGRNVSLDENLFYTGISSLYAHYFLASIRDKFSAEIKYHEFMKNPTIHNLSSLLQKKIEDMVDVD